MASNTSDPRILLDQHRKILVRDIYSVDPILDFMFGKHFLTEEEKNEILGGEGEDRHSKARRLLDVVKSKGMDELLCFREALRGYYPNLEELLRYCPTHNAPLMFWCEECECLRCEKCKNVHVFPQHVFTAIFSVNEDITTKFDCFIRESRSMLNSLSRKQISSTERREHKLWAERVGVELRTLVSRVIVEEVNWVLAKLKNQGIRTPCDIAEESANTGELEGCRQSDEATVEQHTVQLKHENAGDLRTLLRRNRVKIIKDMRQINPIVNLLHQEGHSEGVLTEEEMSTILRQPTPHKQARTLLDIVSCKGTIEIYHFTKALETTYPHLAELLHQCPEHMYNAKFELYCEICKILICEGCQSKHQGHFITSTTTVTTMCKSEFDRFILDNRENIMDIRRQKICPKEVEKRVKERGTDLRDMVTRKINEEVAMFVSNLDQDGSNFIVSPGDTSSERKGRVRNFQKIARIAVMPVLTMLILLAYSLI